MVTQSIPLVADLRTQNRNIGTIYLATGLVTEGDTGGGIYFWNPASTNADDGFYYIQVTGVATGRWVRIYAGSNIYNTDGSLLDNRDVTLNGSYLSFIGSSSTTKFNADGSVTVGSLSGVSSRIVVANAIGTLGTQAFVPGTTIRFVEKFTATAGQTTFNTINTLYNDLFDVFLNGVKLNDDSFNYTANQIVLDDASYVGDIIDVIGFSSATVYATLPSQVGNAGKYLTTDGTNLSWGALSLSGYVPYTGATATVDLGDNDLEAGSVFVEGASGAGGALRIKQFASSAANLDGYSTISTLNTGVFYFTAATTSPNFKNFVLNPSGLTDNTLRTYTLPNLSGTLALLSDITPGLTSVGLSMPSAFAVSNSPLTSNGTIAVTGAGTASQYVRGDGQLANFPTNGGGGSSVNYYLNGSVTQGTFGGDTYYEMSKTPVLGAGADFTRTNAQGNGYIASFITDAGDPSLLSIPGGNWNLEFYFNASSSGSTPQFYGEIYKVDASNNFTLIASASANPETISSGTTVDQYFTSIPVPQTSLLVTDRLAVRIYVIPSGRTITLHTENSNLCEVLTTFSTGLNALNGLTAQVQYFATGTSGTDFGISSATDTHTFNLPTASATNRGALSSADWTTFSGKVGGSGVTGQVAYWNGTGSQTGSNNLFWDAANARLGIGTNAPSELLSILGATASGAGISLQNADGLGGKIIADNSRLYFYSNNSTLIYSITNSKIRINDGNGASIGFELGSGGSISQNGNGGGLTFVDTKAYLNNGLVISASNLLVGTTTDAGFKLDVNGTARVSGVLTVLNSSSEPVNVKSSASVSAFILDNTNANLWGGNYVVRVNGVDKNYFGTLGSLLGTTNYDATIWATSGNGFRVYTNGNNRRFEISSTGAAEFTSSVTAIKSLIGDNGFGSQWATFAHADATGASNAFVGIDNSNGSQISNIKTNGTFEWRVSNSNVMNLKTTGNLLVGTTVDAGQRLQVQGNAIISTTSQLTAISSTGGLFISNSTTTANGVIGLTGAGFILQGKDGASTSYPLLLQPYGSNVGIGTTSPSASAILQADSTTRGFLPPRMTNAQRTAISSPAVGLIVYCTDATEGLYQYINNAWVNLTGVVTNRQTASYTLALGDSNDLVEMNVATANNLTVPLNSSVAFPIGTKIDIAQYGAGQTTVVATSGVTVRSAGGALKLAVQYSGASLVKIGTDEWYLFGDITV